MTPDDVTAPGGDPRRVADHFFEAAHRWLHRLEITSVGLVCHDGRDRPLGDRTRPALEVSGCLQDLPLHRALDLWLTGVREVTLLRNTCCGEDALLPLSQQWAALLGDRLRVTTRAATPARNWSWSLAPHRVPVDRRGLLGLGRRSTPPWPTHDPTADDDARLLASMAAAGVASLALPPPGVALLASGCTACGVCVQACPQDALRLSTDGASVSLLHASDLCRGEQQCVALCPVEALSIHGQLPWVDVLERRPRVLATVETATCERCRARFPADSGLQLCETCRIRRSDPFGSHLPAAALALLRARGHDHPG